jgi:hypothetical protein
MVEKKSSQYIHLDLNDGKKRNISGRYIDKVVDIVVLNELGQTISGIAFKFVMSE